jgi:hypothetical protein
VIGEMVRALEHFLSEEPPPEPFNRAHYLRAFRSSR